MSLELVLSSLPKDLGQALSKVVGNTALLNSSTSHNIAKNNAVQVCGHVAGRIENVFKLSLHYHAGGRDTSWRPIAGLNPNARMSAFEQDTRSGSVQKSKTLSKLIPCGMHNSDGPVSGNQKIELHNSKNEVFTVFATVDPSVDGNWIASRIVKRLNFQHEEAEVRRRVPAIKGVVFEKTRIYVDLNCGGFEAGHYCRHRFYVVNNCAAFDIFLGSDIVK